MAPLIHILSLFLLCCDIACSWPSLPCSDAPLDLRIKSNLIADLLSLAGMYYDIVRQEGTHVLVYLNVTRWLIFILNIIFYVYRCGHQRPCQWGCTKSSTQRTLQSSSCTCMCMYINALSIHCTCHTVCVCVHKHVHVSMQVCFGMHM